MFSKLVLPLLGGTPSVWNTCLVFFQAALLVGYTYAHALTRVASRKRQAVIHGVLLALSCLALPLAVRGSKDPPPGNAGIVWLIGVLVISLGAPFVMLASGAPLVQRWFADSDHPESANPYFLYAASNLGSLLSLLAYPLIIEPRLTLSSQRIVWSIGYAMLVTVITITLTVTAREQPRANAKPASSSRHPVRMGQRGLWVFYAAVPAALLVAVTTYISTDVAAVPLLWIVPLALYLLTFVIVFSNRPLVRHAWMTRAAPHALVIIAIPIFWGLRLPGLFGIFVHLGVLFLLAMMCHGELARRRPPASDLTEFFVWVAVGGFVGGVFCALVAPVVFTRVYEYPIVLAIAAMLLPSARNQTRSNLLDLIVPVAIAAVLFLIARSIRPLPSPPAMALTILFGIAAFSLRERPLRFGLTLAAVFVAAQFRGLSSPQRWTILSSERSYFGVYRVTMQPREKLMTFYHGTTLHGAQSLDPSRRLLPLTYYHPAGPAGDVFSYTPAGTKADRNVAIVGLGAGSIACYGRSGEHWTYYEIDPTVARIALDRRFFSFIRDCPPSIRIRLGDARLTLRNESAHTFDILVLDAFSSDAIPVHLLTLEAFREYERLLAPHGVIALHISNDHLNLEPVVAAAARKLDLTSLVRRDFFIPDSDAVHGRSQTVWALLARSRSDMGILSNVAQWEPLRPRRDVGVWTDDFSNIVSVMAWR